jgi:hypothetical protein
LANTRPERRRRQPRRPAAYFVLLAAGAVLALGATWAAAHPVGRAATDQSP